MYEEAEVRRAAWDLYVALHNLADGQSFGEVLTSVQDATLGDIDDVLSQLDRCQEVLRLRHPDLVLQVHDTVASWADHPADRLVRLIPLLDALAVIAGSSLPLQVPPTV
ncbi:hypothetical protein [Streptomyces acidiscabies]|uniref:Uncharacterized protein n=1 Tax=Streptomyces acidiscabies TaxID=42234 RepID=A0ABU4MDG6_9ACTN|nr:hypothetical protein [Streptomyces acidiscabies]MDX3026179.1 hypothetical protein [Streptomyces acidiscabies]